MGNYLKSSHQKNPGNNNNTNNSNNMNHSHANTNNTNRATKTTNCHSKRAPNESYLSVASYDSKSNPTDTTSMSTHNQSSSYLNKSSATSDHNRATHNDNTSCNSTNSTSNSIKKKRPTKNRFNFTSSKLLTKLNSKNKSLIVENSVNNLFRKEMSVILQPTVKQTASVIFLHGLGDTGHGWSSVFNSFKKPHIKYIFPTAPIMPVTLNGGFRMNAWFDIYGLTPNASQDEEGIKKSSQILLSLVQEEIKNGIPSEKIYIGGFSQGGATALYTALTAPYKFAGVIALSTWLPLHNRFPQELVQVENKLKTPIIQCHGDSDPIVPIEWSKITVEFLKKVGFTSVDFKMYRGVSHSSSEEEMDDVNDFILKNLQSTTSS